MSLAITTGRTEPQGVHPLLVGETLTDTGHPNPTGIFDSMEVAHLIEEPDRY